MGEHQRICFDRIVPKEYARIADEIAIAENPTNSSILEAAAVRSKLWRPGRILRIKFCGGERKIQERVISHAMEWTRYANLDLDFGEHAVAEIRISFQPTGSWSAVGTDALLYNQDVPTMNFGWLRLDSSEDDFSSTVLHEFGHALGLIHEHQSPAEGMRWNKEAVIKDLSGPPNNWGEETIRLNLFARYSRMQTQFTAFDPTSIMVYPVPAHWTLDLSTIPWNTNLSTFDKGFISVCYP